MKQKTILLFLIISFFTTNVFAQGCENLLMNGVFNTFNAYTGSYSSAEWHNFWCNGTVEKSNSSTSTNATLNVIVGEIPLGMSFDDAKEFQRVYQSINCGSNSGSTQNFSTNSVIQKVASPEILRAYIDCKKLQSSGLIIDMSLRPNDKKVFVVDVKYTGAWTTGSGPKVRKVSFLPNLISTREGTLQDGIELVSGQTFSMICERSAEYPITVYVETEVGTFHSDISPTIPPPTDQEKVMNALPRGTIFGWFDPIKIPKGWALCDGGNGTPNLVDKIPLGTSLLAKNIGITTGNANHTHSVSGKTSYETKYDNLRDGNRMQGAGPQCMAHDHTFSGTTEPADNMPPANRIMFIMKL